VEYAMRRVEEVIARLEEDVRRRRGAAERL
jgi:hypothetical protein